MNLYFLVEGRRTELKVYPRWLSELLPHYTRVDSPDQAAQHHYYLVSGLGYPALLHDHLANAIADVDQSGRYHYLILCLDADEMTIAERTGEVLDFLSEKSLILRSAQLQIVVQNRTIETWFLGNRRMVPRAPQAQTLREYLAFHDVGQLDPERMGCYPGFRNHADFHEDYLKQLLLERNVRYTKEHPRHVTDRSYLDQLLARPRECPGDLSSFQRFVDFINQVRAATGFEPV